MLRRPVHVVRTAGPVNACRFVYFRDIFSWVAAAAAAPAGTIMKAIFLDCNDQLAPVWARVVRPDDPPIDVNRKAFARDELPKIIGGYDIAIDDH